MEAGNLKDASDVVVKRANPMKAFFPLLVLIGALVVSFVVFYQVFGDPTNFEGGEAAAEELKTWTEASGVEKPDPTKGHAITFFGIIYKGGVIIPIALTIFIMLVVFVVERFIALFIMASGRGSNDVFAYKVRQALQVGDLDGAIDICDKQRGSVASVCKSGLIKYKSVEANQSMDTDQKKAAIQQELEEATSLELPSLESNLVFLATFVSIGVLVGLLGTVIGMIKAFQALATAGVPDAAQLSTGISEALVNTALGILTSTFAIVFYNLFTSRIDKITYGIDETGFSIVQTFEKTH